MSLYRMAVDMKGEKEATNDDALQRETWRSYVIS
jgi:hypothetical protein